MMNVHDDQETGLSSFLPFPREQDARDMQPALSVGDVSSHWSLDTAIHRKPAFPDGKQDVAIAAVHGKYS
jgi:hypothetical protein